MNKQEAIEKIKNIGTLNIYDKVAGQQVDMVIKNEVLDIISQIDEHQKAVVPKFVAEWIDTLDEHGLFGLNYDIVDKSVQDWVYENYGYNAKKLHLAYLYGYEIEQEKLYTVEIPNPNINTHTILQKVGEGLVLITVTNARWRGWAESKLTESEIKQDFDFLWQFAKEVE